MANALKKSSHLIIAYNAALVFNFLSGTHLGRRKDEAAFDAFQSLKSFFHSTIFSVP